MRPRHRQPYGRTLEVVGGAERIRRIERDMYRRVLVANFSVNGVSVGAGIVAALTVQELPDGSSPIGPMTVMFGVSVPYFAAVAVVAWLLRGRLLAPAVGWIIEGRAAEIGETLELIKQPGKQTRVLFIGWFIGGPLVGWYV